MAVGATFLPISKLILSLVNQIRQLEFRTTPLDALEVSGLTERAFATAGGNLQENTVDNAGPDDNQTTFSLDKTVINAIPAFGIPSIQLLDQKLEAKVHSPPPKTPKPDEWTIILIDERHDFNQKWRTRLTETKPMHLRYAFITPHRTLKSMPHYKTALKNIPTLDIKMQIPVIEDSIPPSQTGEIYQYKDTIAIADVEQFLAATLPGPEGLDNEVLRRKLKGFWDESMKTIEASAQAQMQAVNARRAGPAAVIDPTIIHETSVCNADEVEEALRFFLKAVE